MKTNWRQWRPSWQSDFHVCSFLEARHVTGRVCLSRKAHFTVRWGDYCVASFITLTGFLQIQGFATFDVKCSQPALQAERRLTDEYECATWLSMHMYVKLDEAGIETDLQYHLYTAFSFPVCLWANIFSAMVKIYLVTKQSQAAYAAVSLFFVVFFLFRVSREKKVNLSWTHANTDWYTSAIQHCKHKLPMCISLVCLSQQLNTFMYVWLVN